MHSCFSSSKNKFRSYILKNKLVKYYAQENDRSK